MSGETVTPEEAIKARLPSYERIEQHRQRPLIVYATSTRANVPAFMAGDAVREFIDQIDAITDGTSVDVLVHSAGGDALAAWRFMAVLRERFENISVLVPHMAFSAATMFCLGANEIFMHPHAALGPIDPQICVPSLQEGQQRRFSYEDVGAFLRFLTQEVNLSEQAYVSPIIEKLFATVDPLTIGNAQRASELSTDVGVRLLETHMTTGDEKSRAREIAENLNKSFYSHGDAVTRKRAKELHLKISEDAKLEKLMWEAFLGLEKYMELRNPFNPLHHLLSDPQAEKALKPSAPLILPPNTPPQLVENMWNQVAQLALQGLSAGAAEVEFSHINAVLESTRLASEFRTDGTVFASRVVGGDIQVYVTTKRVGWKGVFPPST